MNELDLILEDPCVVVDYLVDRDWPYRATRHALARKDVRDHLNAWHTRAYLGGRDRIQRACDWLGLSVKFGCSQYHGGRSFFFD